MNKLFYLAVTMGTTMVAVAQTNVVKISALPTISSLSGLEIIPLDQSGTTKSTTLAQAIAAGQSGMATAAALIATNSLIQTVLGAALSNDVTTASNIVAVNSANQVNATNMAQVALINTASNANATATATLAVTVTANAAAASAALVNTNTLLQAELTTLTGGVSNGIQQNGNGTLNTATLTNIVNPTLYLTATAPGAGSYTSNLVFSSTFQHLTIAQTGSGSQWLFSPQNFVDGQTVTLLVKTTGGSATFGSVTTATNASGVLFPVLGAGLLTTATATAHTCYLNWLVTGGIIIFSGANY